MTKNEMLVFGFIMFTVLGLMFIAERYEINTVDQETVDCEKKGGTLLRNTYKVGKANKVERLCVSSEFILNPKEK